MHDTFWDMHSVLIENNFGKQLFKDGHYSSGCFTGLNGTKVLLEYEVHQWMEAQI